MFYSFQWAHLPHVHCKDDGESSGLEEENGSWSCDAADQVRKSWASEHIIYAYRVALSTWNIFSFEIPIMKLCSTLLMAQGNFIRLLMIVKNNKEEEEKHINSSIYIPNLVTFYLVNFSNLPLHLKFME